MAFGDRHSPALLSVAEAAAMLGVHPQRVQQRIRTGSLPAHKVGNQWILDAADVHRIRHHRRRGRPLTYPSAWAVIAAAADLFGIQATYPAQPRAKRDSVERLRTLLADEDSSAAVIAAGLAQTLRRRAIRRHFIAAAPDVPELRQDNCIALSGVSLPASGLSAGGMVEGYVLEDDLAAVAARHLLTQNSASQANVILHVLPVGCGEPSLDVVKRLLGTPLAVAADLAEHDGVREQHQAVLLLQEVRSRVMESRPPHA